MDNPDDYLEVSPNEILHRTSHVQDVVRDPKIEDLPIESLPWEDFEKMSLMLFSELKHTQGLQVFRYGSNGYKQHGLDLIALNKATGKLIVAECKRVAKLNERILSSWVERFLEGEKAEQSEKFFLITTNNISAKPTLVDHWHKLSLQLIQQGIESELWDFRKLLTLLKHSYSTVEDIYGFSTAERFCLASSGMTKYPSAFGVKKISESSGMTLIENRSIRLDISPPSKKKPHLCGGLLFARADLNGFSIAFNSQFFIKMMQYRAHSPSLRGSPFFYGPDEDGKYLFALPYARLTLDDTELDDLDWIIEQAWSCYIESARALESNWRTLRFARLSDDRFVFKLCKVERWFWNIIKSYLHEFDCDKGSTEHYIYDSAGCIKVYVPTKRGNIEPGYHLIMYAHPSDSTYSTDLILGWEPLSDIGGSPVDLSPRKGWDAEYTHNWLMDYFFPRVYEWAIQRESNSNKSILDKPIKEIFTRQPNPEYIKLENIVWSCTDISRRNIGLRVTNKEEAVNLALFLQSHYSVYLSKAPIEPELIRSVIRVCSYVLSTRPDYTDHYFKSNLRISGTDLYTEIVELEKQLREGVSPHLTSTWHYDHYMHYLKTYQI